MRQIIISNESSLVTDAVIQAAVNAIQKQVSEQVAPVWGLDAQLQFHSSKPPAGVEVVHVLDDSDQAGALGYHTLDASGYPQGYVFVRTCQTYKTPWTTTLSHEVLEQLVDPFAFSAVPCGWQGKPAAVALEVCDAVENDTYTIDGVPVSNWIYPGWYGMGGSQFDYLEKLTSPLSLTSGGYVAYTPDNRSWLQSFGAHHLIEIHDWRYGRMNRRRQHANGHTASLAVDLSQVLAITQQVLQLAPVAVPLIQQILQVFHGQQKTPVVLTSPPKAA